jgi:hypothetical protein
LEKMMNDELFESLSPVAPNDFGPVVLPCGDIGYYDDDGYDSELVDDGCDDEDLELMAIVYLGEPFKSDYVFVPHDSLRRVPEDVTYLPLVKWVKDNPEAARKLGVSE